MKRTQTGWFNWFLHYSRDLYVEIYMFPSLIECPGLSSGLQFHKWTSLAPCHLCLHEPKERNMEHFGAWLDCLSSLLVGDAPLPGGQHVVEGVPANACPGEASQRTAIKQTTPHDRRVSNIFDMEMGHIYADPCLNQIIKRGGKVCAVT